jgi:hypothetical protein
MGSGEEIITDLRLGNEFSEKRKSMLVIVKYSIRDSIIGRIVCQKQKLLVGVSNLFEYW